MLLNFNFPIIGNRPIDNLRIKSDYAPKVDDVIDFKEYLRNFELAYLKSDFIITNISLSYCSEKDIENIIHLELHHDDD